MPFTLPPIVWILLLLVIITTGALLVLGRYYEKATGEQVKALRSDLRRSQSAYRTLVEKAQAYSGRDPEPYRSPATRVHELLSSLRHNLAELERSYVEINEILTRLKHQPWQKTLAAPASWPPLRKDICHLNSRLQQLNKSLAETETVFQGIEALPWEIAQQIRSLHKSLNQINELLEELSRRGLYGDTFEAAVQLSQELDTKIQALPAVFLTSSQEELLQGASRETTIQVYDVIEFCNPMVNEMRGSAAQWESQQALVASQLTIMKGNLHNLETILFQSPSNLDVSVERDSWQKMKEISQNLLSTATRLEVESIPLVCQETGKLLTATQDLFIEITHAQQEHSAFVGLLRENGEELRTLTENLDSLAKKDTCPIQWVAGRSQLVSFSTEVQAMGIPDSLRSPALVSAHLTTAARIRTELIDLKRQFKQINQDRDRLLSILNDPATEKIPELIQEGWSLISETAKYSPENWLRAENPAILADQIDQLSSEFNRLVNKGPSISISETELGKRLESSTRLLENSRLLTAQLNEFRQRWDALKSAEAQAKEQIETLTSASFQLQMIARSNPFLGNIALQEIDRQQKNIQKLKDRFSQPEQGRLESRIHETANLRANFEGQTQQWLIKLDDELLNLYAGLGKTLKALDDIGSLEDTPVDQARRLLNTQTANKLTQRDSRKTVGLDETILAAKGRSEIWQECQAVINALGSLQQLFDTYQEAGFQRDQAFQAVGSLPEWSTKKRTWPPISIDLDAERLEFDNLEKEWKSKRSQPARAIALVAHFSSLASRYQVLTARISQFADQRQKDHEEIRDLDQQIIQAAEEWESLLRLYSDNPSAYQEIHDFLETLDDNLAHLERSYLQSELEYHQVIQQMNSILRRVRFYQVALDDEHALDASGRIIRRIQTERE